MQLEDPKKRVITGGILGLSTLLFWINTWPIWTRGVVDNPWLGGLAGGLAVIWISDEIRKRESTEIWMDMSLNIFYSKVRWLLYGGVILFVWGLIRAIHALSFLGLNMYSGQGWSLYTQGIFFIGLGLGLMWVSWSFVFLQLRFRRNLFFPYCLFIFTLPIEALLKQFNQPLQEKATDLAVTFLDLMHACGGINFKVDYWDAYTFYSDRFYLIINETCSGVNLLISMVLYALGFAWITQSNQKQSLWLVTYTLGGCLVFNALRIVMIFLLGHYGDRQLAMGPWHEGSGYLMQGLFFILLAFLRFTLLDHLESESVQTTAPQYAEHDQLK